MADPRQPLVPPGAKFAFGESPFHVKGVLFLGTQSFFESNFAGGFAAFVAQLDRPELRTFFEQRFLAASWYDAMPVPMLVAEEARAMRMTFDQYLQRRTRWQAKTDLGGVYGWALKLTSPEAVMLRLPRVFAQMFDFAVLGETVVDSGHGKTSFASIPEPLIKWLETAISIYCETALKLAGARKVEVATESEITGERAGVRIGTMRFEAAWS